MKIASWNVNSIKSRLPHLLAWLKAAKPDVVCLQETKTIEENFPFFEIEAAGYAATVAGQKAYNGVAILSAIPLEVFEKRLPGETADDQARYVEVLVETLRVASVYLPNGNPVGTEKFDYKLRWMDRLKRHAEALLKTEEPFVLAGDFNVIPAREDVYEPQRWEGDALYDLRTRERFRALTYLGSHGCVSRASPGHGRVHLLGLPGRRLAAGPWPSHRPSAAVAGGRRPPQSMRDRHGPPKKGETFRSHADLVRACLRNRAIRCRRRRAFPPWAPGWVTAPWAASPTVWANRQIAPDPKSLSLGFQALARLLSSASSSSTSIVPLPASMAIMSPSFQKGDGAADGRLRSDMADAEAAGGAREAAIRNEGDLVSHPLAIDGRRRRQHLAHAGTATWPFVAKHDDVAFPIGAVFDGLEGVFLAIEATRGPTKT